MKRKLYHTVIVAIIILIGILQCTFVTIPTEAASSSDWKWPTSVHTIQSDWPNYSSGKYHGGTDFPVALNSPVYSTCDGEVVNVTTMTTSYGKHIRIKAVVDGETVYIRYCHLNGFNVSVGEKVSAGQQIAISGSTGNSTGPHLHYKVRNANDTYNPNLNPRNYLPGSSKQYELINRNPINTPVDTSYNTNVSCTAPSKIYTYDVYGNHEGERYVDPGDPCIAIEAYTTGYWKIDYPSGSERRIAYMKLSEWNPFSRIDNNKINTPVDTSYNTNVSCTAPSKIYTYDEYGNHEGERYVDPGDPCIAIEAYTTGFWKIDYPSGSERRQAYMKLSEWNPFSRIDQGHIMSESEAAGQTIPDGDYWIGSAMDRYYFLDIPGTEISSSGTNVQMWTCDDNMPSNGDMWTIKYKGNGFYKIMQRGSSLCLDVAGGTTANDSNVQVYTSNDSPAQEWSIEATGSGYRLRARCNNFSLDVNGGVVENGANLITHTNHDGSNQKFVFIPANSEDKPLADGLYNINCSKDTSFTLDGAGAQSDYKNNTNVAVWKQAEDIFKISYVGNGWYLIQEYSSGLALDININGNENFADNSRNIALYEKHSGRNQLWRIKKTSDGFYTLASKVSGYYLDLNGGKAENGTNVAQYPYNGSQAQKWQIVPHKWTVSFDANGGTVSPTSQAVVHGSAIGTLPTPKKDGYTFAGWFTDKSAGTEVKSDYKVKGNLKLYAHWTINKYTITYDANGGTVSPTSQTVAYGSAIGTLPTPKKDGYTFAGWFTDKSVGTEVKSDYKVKGNLKLYAHWTINKVNVHFNGNTGTIASGGDYYLGTDDYVYKSKDKKIFDNYWEYNQKYENGLYNATTFKLTKTGYKFAGWSNGTKVFDQDDGNVSANDLYPDITTKSGTITLYAKWDINKVNVHYNANGGTIASGGDYYVGTDSNVYTSKDKKILDNFWQYNEKKENGLYNATTFKLVKDGYKFVGWSNGSTVFDQDDNSVSANALYPDITTKSGTIILYAKWEKVAVEGDCDNDGELGVTDVIMLQKWILSTKNAKLANAKAADLNGDGVIDVFDLALMKRKLISKK